MEPGSNILEPLNFILKILERNDEGEFIVVHTSIKSKNAAFVEESFISRVWHDDLLKVLKWSSLSFSSSS